MEQEDLENGNHSMDSKHHPRYSKKLNFNAPLLSTRRLGLELPANCTTSSQPFTSSDHRVPFSWEQAPGKPKDNLDINNDNIPDDTTTTPRPMLPPSWWRPPNKESFDHDRQINRHHDDDGCDGDVEDDVVSLSEAIDIVEKAELKVEKLDGLKLKIEEYSRDSPISPNFMIERFLPDATALAAAASSALNLSKNVSYSSSTYGAETAACVARGVSVRQSCSPPKGCGLEILWPWRMKHRFCGVKSPVRHGSVTVVQPPHYRSKQKKR